MCYIYFLQKDVTEKSEDDLYEISLEDAKKIDANAEVGDSMLVPCNPEEFGRIAIHSAKQIILQRLKEIEKNTLFSDFKSKEGELIIGYIQRIRDNSIYVDIGNFEGILPKSNQSPHEVYHTGDRIKTLVQNVKQNKKGNVSVFLTRTSPDFVKKLLEVEIPEIYDKTIQIFKIVREPGYRTKVAVTTSKDEIDPVGACVGQKGSRIQNIIKELEGEKIDILKWNIDSRKFIENALTPAKVTEVIITDDSEKKAVAIVDESQLSFAIGKRGLNIKLANNLTDWDIDIKTQQEAIELGIVTDHVQLAEQLFKDDVEENEIDELDLPAEIKIALENNSIIKIEQLIELEPDDIIKIDGFNEEMSEFLRNFIDENFEIVVEETEEVTEEGTEHDGVVVYECPECGSEITEDQTHCPSCGVEITFEEDDEDTETENSTETDDAEENTEGTSIEEQSEEE